MKASGIIGLKPILFSVARVSLLSLLCAAVSSCGVRPLMNSGFRNLGNGVQQGGANQQSSSSGTPNAAAAALFGNSNGAPGQITTQGASALAARVQSNIGQVHFSLQPMDPNNLNFGALQTADATSPRGAIQLTDAISPRGAIQVTDVGPSQPAWAPGVDLSPICGAGTVGDFYSPGGVLKGLIFVFHGGGWDGGKCPAIPTSDNPNCQDGRLVMAPGQPLDVITQAILNGYAVFNLDYGITHGPNSDWGTWTLQVEDAVASVACAVMVMRFYAPYFNIPSNKFGAIGHSAGGHLAALLAADAPNLVAGSFHGGVEAGVSMVGPLNLAKLYEESTTLDSLLLASFVGPPNPPYKTYYDFFSPLTWAQKFGASTGAVKAYLGGADLLVPPDNGDGFPSGGTLSDAGVVIMPGIGHDVGSETSEQQVYDINIDAYQPNGFFERAFAR